MKRLRLRFVRAVTCPVCKALPGQVCREYDFPSVAHQERWDLAAKEDIKRRLVLTAALNEAASDIEKEILTEVTRKRRRRQSGPVTGLSSRSLAGSSPVDATKFRRS